MPDGGGKGHFTTLAQLRSAVDDHERRLKMLEVDITVLTDLTMRRRPRRRRPKSR